MSKKIIAVIAVVTIVFVSVFAACNKKNNGDEDGIYIENDALDLVTDENGEKVLADNGALLVYSTEADGKRATKPDGEYVTVAKQFQPIEDDGVVEDYGFKFTLPEGWKSTDRVGSFKNEAKEQTFEITISEESYEDFYEYNKNFQKELDAQSDMDFTWEDNVDFDENFKNLSRSTIKNAEGMVVIYIFENSNNTYRIVFTTINSDTAIADSEALCKAITFKPYTYYPDVTSATTKAN